MGQDSQCYVKIITDAFRPMNMPVDFVWQVTDVVARYVVGNSDAIHCDSAGVAQVPDWAPTLQGIVADGTAVVIDYDLDMLVDSALGINVAVAGVDADITSVSANGSTVEIVMTVAITADQSVVVDFDQAVGNIRSNATIPVDALSFNDLVANNISPPP